MVSDVKGIIKKVVGGVVVVVVVGIAALYAVLPNTVFPHKAYSDKDFNIKTYKSGVDKDNDGIDDQTDILNNAKRYIATKPIYKSIYYPNTGYPDDNHGVCTDVVAFALRDAGYDLQELIDKDIRTRPSAYNIDKPDKMIDFRRVRNQLPYFKEHAINLTCDTSKIDQWCAGDIVVFKEHVGIISDKRNSDGVPFIIHNANPFQLHFDEDALLLQGRVLGHFRIS